VKATAGISIANIAAAYPAFFKVDIFLATFLSSLWFKNAFGPPNVKHTLFLYPQYTTLPLKNQGINYYYHYIKSPQKATPVLQR
jgi:hypothetical protein